MKSDIPRQFPDTAFQRPGNFRQRFNGDLLLGPFNIADIISRQVGFFGQFLLAQMKPLALGADLGTQRAVNLSRK